MSGPWDNLKSAIFKKVFLRSPRIVKFLESIPGVNSYINAWLINKWIKLAPFRPFHLSTLSDYTSWDSLTDRAYSGRHLPPVNQANVDKLPPVEQVLTLFERPASGMRPCKKSTILFSYFAQWFTDAFLRTMKQKDFTYDPMLRNTSPHDVDLGNLYGQKWDVFGEKADDTRYLRAMRGGTLKSEIINGEEYSPRYYDQNGQPKKEFLPLSLTKLIEPLRHEMRKRPGEPLDEQHFACGGDRVNSQVGFAAINTLFLREHNRICELLRQKYTQWDDERLFQTARCINIGVLAKVVIEEYINHISPLLFKFRLEPGRFEHEAWYRMNWMAIEFNLLYRWHSLVPDHYRMRSAPGPSSRLDDVPLFQTMFNNRLLTERGLGAVLEDASRQTAGEIGLFNTPQILVQTVEKPSIELGRKARLPSYNEYRQLIGGRPARDFDEITPNEEVRRRLQEVYGSVDHVEFYPGIFAEPVIPNSALGLLAGDLVAIDAFSQALTNPLLSKRIYHKETFTDVGMEVIASTTKLKDLMDRNLPGKNEKYHLSMTREEEQTPDSEPAKRA